MKYSKATDYALHAVELMMESDDDGNIGLQELATKLEVSPTYLSKVLTMLVKGGLLNSTKGAHGGYRFTKKKEDISFLDVIRAVEGENSLYSPAVACRENCRIRQTMYEAETLMLDYLEEQKVIDVVSGGTR